MKSFLTLCLLFSSLSYSFSQSGDSLKAQADAAGKMFIWDIEKVEKGSLMFLDVAYRRDDSDSIEYLTMTVAKNDSKPRPDFISIIVPNNIVKSNGIFIKFARNVTKKGERTMELEEGNPDRIQFERCNEETCTARIVDGYILKDDGSQKDVFQKFLNFDHVLVLFIYPDGSHKSVAVPLFSFKKQYEALD